MTRDDKTPIEPLTGDSPRPPMIKDTPRQKAVLEADGVPDGVKVCCTCLQQFPATTEYFFVDNHRPDGLRANCKACHSQIKREGQQQRLQERIELIDRASIKMLERIVGSGSEVPHLAELYQRIIEAFDGVGGFAQHFMANYLMAKPGSMIREKMLQTVIRMGTRVSEEGLAATPVDLLTDEDLERELQSRAERVLRITHDDREDQGHAKVS